MTLATDTFRTPAGEPLQLGELLGRGGEAKVYALRGDPGRAVKLYAHPDAERARKLGAMLARVPADPDRRGGHVSIAWPQALALDSTGRPVGFVMPRVDGRRYLPLHQLYHPRSRRARAPGISWRYLVRIARNLSGTLAALHEAGYVVGDLNESNILVDDRALVTLVDLDSIQVASGTRVFRCTVGKGEYTPPELQGHSFRETTRKASSDRFGLAVLTFLLLMEGNHPFSGVFSGDGEPPGLEENIRARRSPYFGRGPQQPPPTAPVIETLGPELAALLRRSLLGPTWRRPDARAVQDALQALEGDLVECELSSTHAYRSGLPNCPWCARARRFGDAYPAADGSGTGSDLHRTGATARHVPDASARGAAAPSGQAPRPRRVQAAAPAMATAPGSPPRGQAPRAQAQHAHSRRAQSQQKSPPHGPPLRRPSPLAASASGAAHASTLGRAANRPSPRPAQPAGFRGSWALFHGRLPVVSALLVAVSLVPVLLWGEALRLWLTGPGSAAGAGAGGVGAAVAGAVRAGAAGSRAGHSVLAAAALIPPLVAAALAYRLARDSLRLAHALFAVERVLRATLGASLVALVASLTIGVVLGRGSVLSGDWLLLPSFWVVAFVLLLRTVGPRRR
jgi:serine/threonine protein kinase